MGSSVAPRVRVVAVDCFELPYRLRLPFRFGAVTITEGRQAIVRTRVRFEGGAEAEGYAADALAAKWFDKSPQLSDAQNLDQLRAALANARDAYLAAGPATPFALFADQYRPLQQAGLAMDLQPLVSAYGPALLDRAVFDALCRYRGLSFSEGMRANLAGMGAHAVVPDLQGFDLDAFLAALRPLQRLEVRHTVGLLDPIVAADQTAGERVGDGLPETLEEVVAAYGNRYFKLKLSGRGDEDMERLCRIAAVLDTVPGALQVTLDGNEQFADAQAVASFWQRMAAEPRLQKLCAATLFIEQPVARARALVQPIADAALDRPVIIDESDGSLDAFPLARSLGYAGVSTKACKGFYKSLINLARCRSWNDATPGRPYFMSAEDLTTQPGTSLQQDLALVALMGIGHVERNAHHFIDGFDRRPVAEAEALLRAHPDLYHRQDGRVRLRVVDGRIALGSMEVPGFGTSVSPVLDGAAVMPGADWPPRGGARAN